MIKLVNALEFFSENHNVGLSNGCLENEQVLEFLEELQRLGCKVFAELDDDYFDASLYIHLPKNISVELLVLIIHQRPDEVSEEEDGSLRLWWD